MWFQAIKSTRHTFDSSDVYKRPDEYLEAMYGRPIDTPQDTLKHYLIKT